MPSNRKTAQASSRPSVVKPRQASTQQADLAPAIEKLTNLIDVLARRIEKLDN
jgi:hypothetical protein